MEKEVTKKFIKGFDALDITNIKECEALRDKKAS